MFRRILQSLLGVVLLLIALPAGCIIYSQYAPHLLLNETTARLYQFRDVHRRDGDVDLIPGFFAGGERKQDVERELLAGGLEEWNVAYEQLPSGAASMQKFRFSAGSRDIVCGNELFLFIAYDAADELQSATISQGGACL